MPYLSSFMTHEARSSLRAFFASMYERTRLRRRLFLNSLAFRFFSALR
jgi:hypothetical protein